MNNTDVRKIERKINQSKILIFDFDGVIADSVEVKTKAFAELYESYGTDVVEKVIGHHRLNGGMSRFDKFKYYHNNFLNKNINKTEIDQLSIKFSELVFEKVVLANEINSVGEFLNKYCDGERVCVINSATPQVEIQEIIKARGMAEIFTTVLGSPSTKLENILKILNEYHCTEDDVVFFGDAESDLMAASDAGVYFVGIGSGIRKSINVMDVDYPCMEDFQKILQI